MALTSCWTFRLSLILLGTVCLKSKTSKWERKVKSLKRRKKKCIVKNQKRMKGTYWLLWKHILARNHAFRSRFWFKATSQFNRTNVKRIVTNEDCLGPHRTSKVRVSMVRNYYHFKDLVVVSWSNIISVLAVGHEIWFGWLERTLSPFCKTLKGINHTKENDASVIFQRITLLLVSQATSNGRKCLLNLWSTWHKYISLTEMTSILCFRIYLIQLRLINVASQLSKAIFRYVRFSCMW